MAALWRIERLDRTPLADPDPATYSFHAVLRDATSGATAVINDGIVKSAWVTQAAWLTAFRALTSVTPYTPNDFTP